MSSLISTLETYIDELKIIANDDDISAESAIALKATELRYMLKGRVVELQEEAEECAS
jgi:hypothetical protein